MDNTYSNILFFFLFILSPNFTQAQFIINEIHADVALGLSGDANGDGIRNAREDEFIEVFNLSDMPLNISGFTLEISSEVKHIFAADTWVQAKSFVLVFGGGNPIGTFGNSQVFLASEGSLGLENGGTHLQLKDNNGVLVDSISYAGNNIDAAWVRDPDFTGDFVPHTTVVAAFGQAFSPGTLSNSFPYNNGDTTLIHFAKTQQILLENTQSVSLFLNLINPKAMNIAVEISLSGGTGDASDLGSFSRKIIQFPFNSISQRKVEIPIYNDTLIEGNETFVFTLSNISNNATSKISINKTFTLTIFDDDFNSGLALTEILADPPIGTEGDANKDGIRDAKQDEFLEFINTTDTSITLSGKAIYDSETLRHQFPNPTILEPKQLIVIFGGGEIKDNFGNALVQTASTKDLSLANNGDQIMLRDSLGNVIFFYEYDATANANQSLVFCPNLADVDGPKTAHTSIDAGDLFSPGKTSDCTLIQSTNTIEQENIPIKIYPNPVTSQCIISAPSDLKLVQIAVLDLQGRLIFSQKNTHTLVWSSEIKTGIYFLKIKTNKGVVIKKVVYFE